MENNEKKPNKNRLNTLILIIAILLILVSGFQLFTSYMEKKKAQDEYDRLAEMAKQTTEATMEQTTEGTTEQIPEVTTEAEYVSPIDFKALAERNPDVVGWITIPDTNVDYPIVQTTDNDKYLHTDFDGNESIAGAVYLDMDSEPDYTGRHNILYGHNMKNGTMFKDVVRFKDKDYFQAHRDIYLYTPERTIHLRTVAAVYGGAEGIKRKTQFSSKEQFDAYVDSMTVDCAFREMPEEEVERLYSLVTCSYEFDNARTILYAVEVPGEGAGELKDSAAEGKGQ